MRDTIVGLISMLTGLAVIGSFWLAALWILFNGPKLLRQQKEILAKLNAMEDRVASRG